MKPLPRFAGPLTVFVVLAGMMVPILAGGDPAPAHLLSKTPDPHSQPEISVTSRLVVLPVNVTDANGNFVSGLTARNFRVLEDKRPQTVTLFEREDTPVCVGLVVDRSASMKLKLPSVISAISAFAHSGNPEDELFVVDFNDSVTIEALNPSGFTSDWRELEGALEVVLAHGRTALYDAVATALEHLQLSHLQRKALIIASDGGDNASSYKYGEVLQLARRSQAAIYSIALLDESNTDQRPGVLRKLAKETGGVVLYPDSPQAVVRSSTLLARDLREQYVLGYAPEQQATKHSFHRIQVLVNSGQSRELHVKTRAGYSSQSESAPISTGRVDATGNY